MMEQKTILLVEDDNLIALREQRVLEQNGYRVIHVPDGDTAVKEGAGNVSVDLILMDINLGTGKMDGTEAAQMILASREIPILFLSSHSEKEVVEKTQEISSYGYITKNSGNTVLLASIQMAFRLFQAHQDLKRNNTFIQSLLETSPDGVWIVSEDGLIIDTNETYCRMSGYTRDELMGKDISELDLQDSSSDVRNRIQDIKKRELERFKSLHLRKDGSILPVDVSSQFITNNDESSCIVFCRDLSLQEDLTRRLQQSRDRFELVLKSIQDTVFSLDRERRFTELYSPFSRELGLDEQDVIGKTFEEVSADQHLAQIHKRQFEKVMQGDPCLYHWQFGFRGRKFYRQTSLSPIKDEVGNIIGAAGVDRDLTDLIVAEKELKNQKELQRTLFQEVPGAIYQYQLFPDGRSCFPFASENIENVYEVVPEQVRKDASPVFSRIHPDDLDRVNASIEESRSKLTIWTSDYRVNLPLRGLRWVRGRATPQRLPDQSTLWHGYIMDITDLKEVERTIQRGLEEKKTLLKEMQHRVMNTFTIINSMISLLMSTESSADAVNALGRIEEKIRSIAAIYDLLYDSGNVQTLFLDEYLLDVARMYHTDFGNIQLIPTLDRIEVSVKLAIPVGIIVNEILTNAYKYAFPDSRAGVIRISMKQSKDSALICIEDNGVGVRNPDHPGESSFGHIMMKAMLEQISGDMSIENRDGTAVEIRFPLF